MANSYTSNIHLAMPAPGDTTWNLPVNANAQILDSLVPIGAFAVVTSEVPSASLNVQVAAGNYLRQDGTIGTYLGSASQTMTASATNYLYLDLTNSGALAVNTTGFPSTAHVRMAIVVAASSTISSITDMRITFQVVGPFADGVNLTFGTTNGTRIGTAANQKLGFFGTTPISQPTLGVATAAINLLGERANHAQRGLFGDPCLGAGKLKGIRRRSRIVRGQSKGEIVLNVVFPTVPGTGLGPTALQV